MHTREMIAAHPDADGKINTALLYCVDACHDCAQACTACADACLGEPDLVHLVQCIRLNLDCADLCSAAASVGSRRTGSNPWIIKRLLDACAEACRLCAEECDRHAREHVHCRICADACRACEQACRTAAYSIETPVH
jgi:hypothetical protein